MDPWDGLGLGPDLDLNYLDHDLNQGSCFVGHMQVMVSFITLTIKMIMQVVYIMGMWRVLADRKFIETPCSVQFQRYVLTKGNAWLINNIFCLN